MKSPTSFPDLLGTLRHDLRTPVGHITGYAEMIEEELEDEPINELAPAFETLRSAGALLLELIDEHLGASKQAIEEIDFLTARQQIGAQVDSAATAIEAFGILEGEHDDLLPDVANIRSAVEKLADLVSTGLIAAALTPCADADQEPEESGPGKRQAPAAAPRSSLGEGGEILVVDDDAGNRDLLARRLRQQGYQAVTVESGERALELLQEQRFDLVLLDLMMPGMSGDQVLATLKADPDLHAVPVIMLSALDDMDRVVQCVQAGAEDYLLKPANPVLLKARIATCLEKDRLRRQNALRLKVFISSPGDVMPERKVLKSVLERLNNEFSGRAFLSPVLWEEEPLLASETAQTQIELPRETDIFVAILWSRMGTRLPDEIRREDGSIYLSGTEFEFEDALGEAKRAGRPDMLTYRKTTEPLVSLSNREQVLDRLEQKERLEAFIKRWFTSPDGESIAAVYHAFEELDEFERMAEIHLRKLTYKHLSASAAADHSNP